MTAATPLVVLLVGVALCLTLHRRGRALDVIGFATIILALSATVVVAVGPLTTGEVVTTEVGGWGAPLGIVLAVDRLAALLLATTLMIGLAALWSAARTAKPHGHVRRDHAVVLSLLAGMVLALTTADLFTLFVGFEVALVASYVLVTADGSPSSVARSTTYIAANVVVSTLFLLAIGVAFAATGTLSFAGLSDAWPDVAPATRAVAGLLLTVVFLTKAAALPVLGWLPDAYRDAHPAIAALFAGLLTKLGIYALLRLETLLGLTDALDLPLLAIVATVTMVGGVMAALAQVDVRRVLSLHIVSQIGYLLFGVSLGTVVGIAGTIFYLVHHMIVKTALFLVAGGIEEHVGGRLASIGGVRRTAPVLAALFVIPALSLAGIPPFSGFVAKLALLRAGVAVDAWTLVVASLVASLLTLLSMAKLWSGVFEGEPSTSTKPVKGRGAIGLLVAASLAVTLAAGPLLAVADAAAGDLLGPAAYIEAVGG